MWKPENTAEIIYAKTPTKFEDKIDGVCCMSWTEAAEQQSVEYIDAQEKAKDITTSSNPQAALLKLLGKEVLLHEFADFTWYWGVDWFVETRLGNFHWKDPSYGKEGSPNTLTLFDGDIHKFRDHVNMEMGRDKGSRFIIDKCGEDFELILPE